MIRALVSGTLHADPITRTSQTGSSYTTARLRADSKDGSSVWCNLVAFGEVADRLATLKAGAALSVAGRAEVSGFLDKAGEPRGSLSLVVDELVSLRARPKPAGASAPSGKGLQQGKHSRQDSTEAGGLPFDDLDQWSG